MQTKPRYAPPVCEVNRYDPQLICPLTPKLSVTKYPPLWTKPAASLANPGEDIPIDEFCATSLPDYEGELVFVTSRDAKNVQANDADSYILGYTIGNDLSCRFFQLPGNSGGQFFYAKAFDNFAPIGPLLVSTEQHNAAASGRRLFTRVNGHVMQDSEITKDMIFTPGQILSHMSRGQLAQVVHPLSWALRS
jgi:2-keto-4-pentenoate hydratase/2-oxohepta-3-ene-1,7-dioic acid hydratase in catechol pathway